MPAGASGSAADVELIDVAFGGGSISDFVEAIRQAARSANIVIMREAAEVPVPPMVLSQVSVGTAVALLPELVRPGSGHLVVTPIVTTLPSDPRTGRPRGNIGQSAYVIAVSTPSLQQARTNSMQQRVTRVETLTRLLEAGLTAERVLEAVEVAVRSTGLEHDTTLAYHEPTRLLVATGPDPSVQAVVNVLGALVPRRSSAELKAMDEQRGQLELALVDRQREAVTLQTRAEVLHEELRAREQQLRQANDQIASLTVERRVAEADLLRLEKALAANERVVAGMKHETQRLLEENQSHAQEMERAQALLARLVDRLKANKIWIDDIVNP